MRSLILDTQIAPNGWPAQPATVIRMQIQPRNGLGRRQTDRQLQLCVPLVTTTLAWCSIWSSRVTVVVALGQEPAPGLEGPVRCDSEGAAFVVGGDEPDQQLGAGGVKRRDLDGAVAGWHRRRHRLRPAASGRHDV